MVDDLPSLELLHDEAIRAEDAQLRRGDSIDGKAGLILGFSGVVGGLALGRDNLASRLTAVPAVVAALLALRTFLPRSFPMLNPRQMRDRYLMTDPRTSRLRILDTRIEIVTKTREILDEKAKRLKQSAWALGVAVISAGVAAIVEGLAEVAG